MNSYRLQSNLFNVTISSQFTFVPGSSQLPYNLESIPYSPNLMPHSSNNVPIPSSNTNMYLME